MRCKYCNANLPENVQTCNYCGRFLGDAESLRKTTAKKRKIWIGIGIVAIAIIFILTTFGGNLLSQKTTNETLTQQLSTKSANTLGMTLEKFREKYNNNDYTKKIGITIEKPQIKTGNSENTFEYQLSNKLLIIGVINKYDNKLMKISVIGEPSNSKEDDMKLIGAMGIIIDTYSPDVPVNQRVEILKELGFNNETDIYKANGTAIRGNVKYTFRFIDKTGFVFSVMNVNYNN